MAKKQLNTPITFDLELQEQSVNIDIESIAPSYNFSADAFDIANSTIVAKVNNTSGGAKTYRLAIKADLVAGASAFVRVVSGNKATFKQVYDFERITEANAEIVEPILMRAGLALDLTKPKKPQLIAFSKQFKIADVNIPAGLQTLRIHLSQLIKASSDNPKVFHLDSYLPLMSFAPTSNVLLGGTVVFPLRFTGIAQITEAQYLGIPGMGTPQLIAGGNTPVMLARQQAYGWEFQNIDPILSLTWQYNS
ncbi:MAG: hypothetical protein WAW60_03925 [Candidatus Saccharimonadales bacterium]